MIKVIFVGDEPNYLNLHPEIAFIGAKCFQKLTKWIKRINPDYYICLNSNTADVLDAVDMLAKNEFKVLALGKIASERLTLNHIHHFTLPHPSGLNRQLNNTAELNKILQEASEYVREA